MDIELKNIITLDGKDRYFVAGKHILDEITYLYIININNYQDVKIVMKKVEDNITKLIDVEDQELIQKLSIKFLKQTRDFIVELKDEK